MKLGTGEKIGYGLGDTACHLIFDMITLYLTYVYTDLYGLPPAAVGTMFLVTRVLDGFIDFSVGIVADRTRSRWGRFRPYLLLMCIPYGVLGYMAFHLPEGSTEMRLSYAWITYFLLMAAYSIINIPYAALSGVMTNDTVQRIELNAYRMGFARVGSLLVSLCTMPLVLWLGGKNEQLGFARITLLYGALAVLLFLITFFTTRERVPIAAKSNPIGLDLRMLLRNKPWMILFAIGVLVFASMIVSLGSTVYFVKYVVGQPAMISVFLTVSAVATFFGVPFTKPLAQRFGKAHTFMVAQAVAAGLFAASYFVARDQVVVLLVLRLLSFSMIWLAAPLLWTMIADTADYADCKLGVRATGVIFSAATCAHKMGLGLGGAITGWWLAWYGYAASAAQSEHAIHGIQMLHTLVPAAGSLLLVLVMWRYPITESDCVEFRRQLDARAALTAGAVK